MREGLDPETELEGEVRESEEARQARAIEEAESLFGSRFKAPLMALPVPPHAVIKLSSGKISLSFDNQDVTWYLRWDFWGLSS